MELDSSLTFKPYNKAMCGRFRARQIDLRRFHLSNTDPGFEEFTDRPQFEPIDPANPIPLPVRLDEVRPMDRAPIIRVIGDEMRADLLQWWFVPPFEPEPKTKLTTFNARAETIATSPTFRHAWKKRQRCLVPIEAFFEWKGDKPPKQKYCIGLKTESQFCLAGLWEKWQREDKMLESFTIITTQANELVAEIHSKKRMPVILDPDHYDRWLHANDDVADLLKPYPSECMQAVPVNEIKPAKDRDGPSLFTKGK